MQLKSKFMALLLSLAMGMQSITPTIMATETSHNTSDYRIDMGQMQMVEEGIYRFPEADIIAADNALIYTITIFYADGRQGDGILNVADTTLIEGEDYQRYSNLTGANGTLIFTFRDGITEITAENFIQGLNFTITGNSPMNIIIDKNAINLPTIIHPTTGENIVKVTMYIPEDDPGNPHYYMWVPEKVDWDTAYEAAKSYRYMGMIGYLVNTPLHENIFWIKELTLIHKKSLS